jgi:hypothetical protein
MYEDNVYSFVIRFLKVGMLLRRLETLILLLRAGSVIMAFARHLLTQ